MQVLGTPTREEIKCMNPNYTEFKFPQIKAHPWHKVPAKITSALSLKNKHGQITWIIHLYACIWLTDIPQAHAPWSCGPCLQTITVFSEPPKHSCEYKIPARSFEYCYLFSLFCTARSNEKLFFEVLIFLHYLLYCIFWS
jgi:hypothetical protein